MWLERETQRMKLRCPDCGLRVSLALFPAWQRGGLVGPYDSCQDCSRVLSERQTQALLDAGHTREELRAIFPEVGGE